MTGNLHSNLDAKLHCKQQCLMRMLRMHGRNCFSEKSWYSVKVYRPQLLTKMPE